MRVSPPSPLLLVSSAIGLNPGVGAVQLVPVLVMVEGPHHSAEQPPVTLGQAGQSSAGRGLTSVEQRVWRLTHMQGADTECSAVYDDIQSDVMMQSDHDHIQSEDIK